MSDVGSFSRLAPSAAQLPVHAYLDEAVLRQELASCFRHGPGYVGHEAMVPEIGSYATLAHEDHGRVLVRNAQGVQLLSNICRHRQAIMLEGQGQTESIVCPLHRWTYDMKGELVGAPHFPQDPCRHLKRFELARWNGLLFEGSRAMVDELSTTPFMEQLDFSPAPRSLTNWTLRALFTPRRRSITAITTGRASSRSTWTTTMSTPFTPALEDSLTAKN
jgi:phenylpropionate dioxygenase-like ring-hydroxylating dioxygenase large terminal subunit